MSDALSVLASVVAVGATTSLGLDARQTSALYRAGFAGMGEAALGDGDAPITMCRAPVEGHGGTARRAALGQQALREVTAALGVHAQGATLVCSCEDKAAIAAWARGFDDVRTYEGGAAFAAATMDALSMGKLVVAGGVHSDHDVATIAELAAAGRLYGADNLSAVIPGEAAAFAAFVAPRDAKRVGLAPLVHIIAVGSAMDEMRPNNLVPAALAQGLTSAVKAASAPLEANNMRAGWLLSDLTFEDWRAREWQAVYVRAAHVLGPPHCIDNPAQRLGHLGVAALPLSLVLVAEANRHGHAPSPLALTMASSDDGARTAMLLAAP